MNETVKEKSVRSSNFELLRILAMFLIVGMHIIGYSGIGKPETYNNFSSTNKVWLYFFFPGGDIGNNIFFLLMGYFLISKENQLFPDFKKIKKLITQVYFYALLSLIIFGICYCFHLFRPNMGTKEIILSTASLLMPVSSEAFWFITTYLFIYVFIFYIFSLLRPMGKNKYWMIVFALAFINIARFTNTGRYNQFLYSIVPVLMGGGIRLYRKHFSITALVLFLLCIILLWVVEVGLIQKINILSLQEDLKSHTIFLALCELSRNTQLIIAVFIFLLFGQFRIKQSKTLNYIASCIFAVYLIHVSPLSTDLIFNDLFKVNEYYKSDGLLPICFFGLLVSVFALAIVLEFLRNCITNKIVNFVNKRKSYK